jgi:hypothetical protein
MPINTTLLVWAPLPLDVTEGRRTPLMVPSLASQSKPRDQQRQVSTRASPEVVCDSNRHMSERQHCQCLPPWREKTAVGHNRHGDATLYSIDGKVDLDAVS